MLILLRAYPVALMHLLNFEAIRVTEGTAVTEQLLARESVNVII